MSKRLLSLVLRIGLCAGLSLALAAPASAIPAFARKYGLRCTTCHESWPVLNDFGRNFRDNGYQLRLGKDDVVTADTAYWPVSVHITPHYEFDTVTNQATDQGTKTLKSGGIADAGMDLLTAGVLTKDISFLVVPTGFASDGNVHLESYWADFSRVIDNSDWFNIRIGKHEVDLSSSPHRSIDLTFLFLVYGYHPGPNLPNAAAAFDLDNNQLGFEINGHDKTSMTRYNISIFSANDANDYAVGSRQALSSPSIYGHFQKYFRPADSSVVSQYEFGVWGAYANYPTTTYTLGCTPQFALSICSQILGPGGSTSIPGTGGNVEPSSRYGVEGQIWLGQLAAPLHLNLNYAKGSDSRALYLGADRAGTWQGGFLEAIWVPSVDLLHWGLFARYDFIRNKQQPLIAAPSNLGDQNQVTAGVRYTFAYTNRDEVALHTEYATNVEKGIGVNGLDVRTNIVFFGVDFLY
jgi:hypothetical protein